MTTVDHAAARRPRVYSRIYVCFCCRHGKIQSVKLVPRSSSANDDQQPPAHSFTNAAVVAFMDIRCASRAHDSLNVINGATVVTSYNESFSVNNITTNNCIVNSAVSAAGGCQSAGRSNQQSSAGSHGTNSRPPSPGPAMVQAPSGLASRHRNAADRYNIQFTVLVVRCCW